MDFNIAKYLDRKPRALDPTIKVILEVLVAHAPDIQASNIDLKNRLLILRELSPQARTYLKLKESKIMDELNQRGLNVRGIL